VRINGTKFTIRTAVPRVYAGALIVAVVVTGVSGAVSFSRPAAMAGSQVAMSGNAWETGHARLGSASPGTNGWG
jgi:hypothetical protein